MRRLKTTLAIFMCAFSVASFAQSVKNKAAKFNEYVSPKISVADIQKVKISVYPGPGFDMSQNDLYDKKGMGEKMQAKQDQINGIGPKWIAFQSYELVENDQDATIEVAFGEFQQLDKKLKDHKITCIRDDGKLDKEDLKECPAYYYEVGYELPVVVKITDRTGKVLNMDHLDAQGTQTFGYVASGQSGYLKTSELDAAFNKPGASKSIMKGAVQDRLKEIGLFLQENFFFQEEKAKVDFASGGGKLNYDDLDEAQTHAIQAVKSLQGSSSNDNISKAIEIWNNALKEQDMNDKKARINRKVAGFVALNKAKGYFYMQDYENALASADESAKFLKFSGNTAHMEHVDLWKRKISLANGNALSIANNSSLLSGEPVKTPASIIELINIKEKSAPYAIVQQEQKYEAYKNDYLAFQDNPPVASPKTEAEPVQDLASILNGGANVSWEDRVQKVSNMGYYISIAYSTNETIPVEICELEMLNTLLANNSKISSLPSQIGQLKNLKTLNLASNDLTSLPDEMGDLENLTKLNLSKNQITSLPASLVNCRNLKSLMLKGNKIPQSDIDKIQAALPKCKIKL